MNIYLIEKIEQKYSEPEQYVCFAPNPEVAKNLNPLYTIDPINIEIEEVDLYLDWTKDIGAWWVKDSTELKVSHIGQTHITKIGIIISRFHLL